MKPLGRLEWIFWVYSDINSVYKQPALYMAVVLQTETVLLARLCEGPLKLFVITIIIKG